MALFSLMCLVDKRNVYKQKMQSMIHDRLRALWKASGLHYVDNDDLVGYYSEIDVMVWAEKLYDRKFAEWLKANRKPLDFVLRLAAETGVVLLNGGGFAGPDWSVRASLANLTEEDYLKIGQAIMTLFDKYHKDYLAAK